MKKMRTHQRASRLCCPAHQLQLANAADLLKTTQGRSVLQRLLRGRITFLPEGTGYVFTAPTRFDKLFSGIMAPLPAFLIGEPIVGKQDIGPEDTHDGDYGRLLEQAAQKCVKWVTSPTGAALSGL